MWSLFVVPAKNQIYRTGVGVLGERSVRHRHLQEQREILRRCADAAGAPVAARMVPSSGSGCLQIRPHSQTESGRSENIGTVDDSIMRADSRLSIG